MPQAKKLSPEESAKIVEKRKATIAAAKQKEQEKFDAAVEKRVKMLLAEKEVLTPNQPVSLTEKEVTRIERHVETIMKQPASTPWKPFKRLHIPTGMKDPRFHYHFVDTTREGNELACLNEGYEYDMDIAQKLKERNLAPKRPLNDGSGLDGTYRVNELVLMRIPIEQYNEHLEYYRNKGKTDKETIKRQMRNDIGKEGAYEGAKVYTDSFGVQGLNQEEFG